MPERNIGLWSDDHWLNTDLNWYDTAIVGIDPGVTTGISVIGVNQNELPMPEDVEHWGSDQLSYGGSGNIDDIVKVKDGYVEQMISHMIGDVIEQLTAYYELRVIVAIEDFIVRQQNSSREFLAPVRITAGIVQEIYELPNVKVVYQSPSDAKTVCKDERMDKWGYNIRTQKDRHARDADRHSILFLRRAMEKPSRLKI